MKNLIYMKRKFIFFGFINVLISNLFLQLLLLINFIPISISTLLFILFNAILGYVLYGKFVFKISNIINKNYIYKYSFTLLLSWLLLNIIISYASIFKINPNLSSVIMIPFLAIYSFLMQKYWIFKY